VKTQELLWKVGFSNFRFFDSKFGFESIELLEKILSLNQQGQMGKAFIYFLFTWHQHGVSSPKGLRFPNRWRGFNVKKPLEPAGCEYENV
jgi:hypothetical protein